MSEGVVRTLQLRDPNDGNNDVVNGSGAATNGFFALSAIDGDAAGAVYASNLAITGATGPFNLNGKMEI